VGEGKGEEGEERRRRVLQISVLFSMLEREGGGMEWGVGFEALCFVDFDFVFFCFSIFYFLFFYFSRGWGL
jgi:hypothetical protein